MAASPHYKSKENYFHDDEVAEQIMTNLVVTEIDKVVIQNEMAKVCFFLCKKKCSAWIGNYKISKCTTPTTPYIMLKCTAVSIIINDADKNINILYSFSF